MDSFKIQICSLPSCPSSSPCRLCSRPAHTLCRRPPHVTMPSPSDLVVLPHTFPTHSRDAIATSLHTDPCSSSGIVDLRRHSPSPHPLHVFNRNDSIRVFLTSLPLWYSSSPSRQRSIRNVSCHSYPCCANAEHPTEYPF